MAIGTNDTLQSRNQETLSAAATGQTSAYKLANRNKFSLHLLLTNTDAAGTITIQTSNDKTNWYTLPVPQLSVSAGVDVNEVLEVDSYAAWLRVVYTKSSGGTEQTFSIYLHTITR